jgi:hypothetical protein
MIKPTIGRVVWYYDETYQPGEQPRAAIVTFVLEDDLVNLCTYTENGLPKPKQSVTLRQDSSSDLYPYCAWMPYQIGQAKASGDIK